MRVSLVWRQPALPLAAGEFGAKRRERSSPETLEWGQPLAGCLWPLRIDRIEPAGALGSHGDEAVLPQYAQVLGNRWLTDAKLRGDSVGDGAGRFLTLDDEFEDASADRVSENIECVHVSIIHSLLI